MKRTKTTIAAARHDAGLSLRKTAAQVGVSYVTILRWERGEGAPSWRQMQALAATLCVPTDQLVQVQADMEWDPEGKKSDGWTRADA